MTLTLDDLVKIGSHLACRHFDKHQAVPPTWIGITADGERLVYTTPFGDADEKALVVAAMKLMFRLHEVRQYILITEAWWVDVRQTESGKFDPSIPPSLHPDRREVVNITAEDATSSRMGHHFILRPEHGKATLSPLKLAEQTRTDGLMVGLLRQRAAEEYRDPSS